METFALYLVKSVIWLTGFALVYILFLKNERFFELNRIFLLSGILAALILPFISVSYKVILPVISTSQAENAVVSAAQNTPDRISIPDFRLILFYLYLAGLLFVAFMIIKQGRSLLRVIRRTGVIPSDPVKLIRTAEYDSAFSFFSYVFVNPSVTEIEMREIMNHEIVHIRQKHWFDLLFVQLLCVLQWFNPVIWIYIRFVRQNHEYIADKVALQRTSDPAIYRAALLNQIVGSPVISLVNSFSFSVNKKRFSMMKNKISSPYRKMKIFFILPVFAIVFYAFAKPDYQYPVQSGNPGNQNAFIQTSDKKISGTIVLNDGEPLPGAHVLISNTNIGTTTDVNGNFSLENVPSDAAIIVTFVGFKSKIIKSDFVARAPIRMERDTINLGFISDVPAPPPPPPPPPSTGMKDNNEAPAPPPPALKIKNTNGGPPPLIVVDGVIRDIDVNSINPETIESINVLKDKPATDKYNEKGKNGVIEITTKKAQSGKDMYVAVEELPGFPGGSAALQVWIKNNLKPEGKEKVSGVVPVTFVVTKEGKIAKVKVNKPVDPFLDKEAVRVISSMPDWKPGKQGGKAVDVQMMMPVEFKLK